MWACTCHLCIKEDGRSGWKRRRGGGQFPEPIGNGVWPLGPSSPASDLLLSQMHKHSGEGNKSDFLVHVQCDGRCLMLIKSKIHTDPPGSGHRGWSLDSHCSKLPV